jgi:hypothetical protein
MSAIPDPNPGFGKSTLFQKVYAFGAILYLLPKTLVSVIISRLFRRYKPSFKEHFTRAMISQYARCICEDLPIA